MDRPSQDLDRDVVGSTQSENPILTLGGDEERLVERSRRHLAVPEELLRLNELDVLYDAELETLWTYMRPVGRPSFNPAMLDDFEDWQRLIASHFGPGTGKVSLRFLVLGSRSPGVFCFGGDLELFQRLIREGNRPGLVEYGYRCVEILYRNLHALDLPMLTVGLVEGAALGGGFEALLSFDYIVAERGATFGLPEIMFGLFPGMGAHALLSRKLGTAMADRLIVSNETYTAEQMYELGLVHRLAEPGEGLSACRDFIVKSERRHAGLVAARKAMKISAGLALDELKRIVELWADTALNLREQDLKVMNRLATAQARLADAA
jgi:DSF synthase